MPVRLLRRLRASVPLAVLLVAVALFGTAIAGLKSVDAQLEASGKPRPALTAGDPRGDRAECLRERLERERQRRSAES